MSYLIAKCAFMSGQDFLVSKFSQEALQRDNGKNIELSAIIRILDGLYCMMNKNYEVAVLKLIEVQIPDYDLAEGQAKPALFDICTPTDLAYYISLCALMSCNRLTLKNTILKSNFIGLIDGQGMDALTLIESFLNGNYQEFQRCL